MKLVKILSLICFLTVGVFAQTGGSITGTVTKLVEQSEKNAATVNTSTLITPQRKKKKVYWERKPVAGAIVELREDKQDGNVLFTTTTDVNGVYGFYNVPASKYLLAATEPATEERNVQTDLKSITIKNGQVIVEELKVSPGIYIGSLPRKYEVTVIASGKEQRIEQVSKTVNVIEAQELRDRADFALVESLRTIPGFRVQQLGGFGRTANIKTRGLRNQDTAVLIDGIRFRDASSITGDASAFLSDFTLTSVSKIEVLRGSGSSLYGTNAIGGTIDFQTPKPQSGFHGQIGGAFGGYGLGRFRGNLSDGARDGKFGFNLGVSRTVYAEGIDGEDDAHNTNFQSRVEYNPFQNTNISARFFVSDAYVRLNSNPDTLGSLPPDTATIIDAKPNVNFIFDQNDPDNFQKSQFFNGQIVLTQIINKDLVFQGFYSGLRTSRKNTNGSLGAGFQPFAGDENYIFDGQIHTANGHFNWTARNNLLTAGYEYEREKFGNDGVFANASDNFSTRARQSSNTFYAQDLLSFFKGKLQISGAFRAQWFALETPTFSSPSFPNRFNTVSSPPASYTGDGSVSYYFEKAGTKLRAHVGNGYRVPSLYERFGSYFFFNSFFGLGNPDLKPERSIAFDGGIEQNLLKNRVRLVATYFYTKINDEVSYLPTDDLGAPSYFNFDRHFSRGAELSAQIKATDTTNIFASYTFTNSDTRVSRRLTFLPPATIVSRDRKSFGVPDHQFTLVATQRFKRAWVNFDFLATGDYLAPIFSNTSFQTYVYRFKGNRKADLTAGYTFGFKQEKMTLRVFGTIENLFDYEYYENGFRTFGRNGRVGLSFGF